MSATLKPPAIGDWREAIPATERSLYEQAGFGRRSGLGSRPALLIIDVQYRTVGDTPKPFFESVREHYPTSCGEAGWAAVANIAPLLTAGLTEQDAVRQATVGVTAIAGFCGLPEVTLPVARVRGAPVGLSLVGGAGHDRALLALACDAAAVLGLAV